MAFDNANRNEAGLMKRIAPLFYENLYNKQQTEKDAAKFAQLTTVYNQTTPDCERRVSLNCVEFFMDNKQCARLEAKDIICLMYRYHIDNLFHYSANKSTTCFNFSQREMGQIGDVIMSYDGVVPHMLEMEKIDADFYEAEKFDANRYDTKLMDMYRIETLSNMLINMRCFQTFQNNKNAHENALNHINRLGASQSACVRMAMVQTRDEIFDSRSNAKAVTGAAPKKKI